MKIRGRKPPRNRSGNYDRLFGDPDLGLAMSTVHSAAISAGKALESAIVALRPLSSNTPSALDEFLGKFPADVGDGVWTASKTQIKKSKVLNPSGGRFHEPDLVVFESLSGRGFVHVVEIKIGHAFDTKKSGGERRALDTLASNLGGRVHATVRVRVCCFFQMDKRVAVDGLKGRFELSEIMTGPELCDLLGRPDFYDRFLDEQCLDSRDNRAWLRETVLQGPSCPSLFPPDLPESGG